MQVVDIHELTKTYGRITALSDVSLQVDRGEIFGLLGQNGAGKSTMIKVLLGIVRKTDGEANLLGQPAGTTSVRAKVGYLSTDINVYNRFTPRELLRLFGEFQGVEAKLSTFDDLLDELKFAPAQAGYMGDDLLDLPVLLRAGFAATVPHAPAVLVEHAHFVASRPAGAGAVREVCEMILRRQGVLDGLVAEYLR